MSVDPAASAPLLRLVSGFVDAPLTSLSSLASGVFLFRFLHALEPSHFDLEPLQVEEVALVEDASARAANLQYLLDCLETFFEEVQQRPMDLTFLDVATMSDSGPEAEAQLMQLLELVLLCAINTARKEEVVHAIMSMTDAEQQTLMHVIHAVQERADRDHPTEGGVGSLSFDTGSAAGSAPGTPARKSSEEPASPATAALSGFASSAELQAARAQVASLQAERTDLTRSLDDANREVREWKRRAHELTERIDAQASASAAERARIVEQTTADVSAASSAASKAEVARLTKESSRAALRISELEHAHQSAQEAVHASARELAKVSEVAEERSNEIAHLRDELQVATSRLEELSATQARLDKLKTRLAEMDELRLQAQSLESENSKQLDRIIELESEAREVDALKAQLTRMKDAAFESETNLLDRTLAEEQARTALAEAKDSLALVRAEHRAMETELKTTKAELAQARMAATQTTRATNSLGSEFADADSSSSADRDAKQTIRRLEYEVTKLRAAAAASSSSSDVDGGASASEVSLLRQQKESLQEKYLESQRKSAAQASDAEKRLRDANERLAAAERATEEERDQWRAEKEHLERTATQGDAHAAARGEEAALLRQELIDLHEQLEALRGANAATGAAPATPTKSTASAAASPARVIPAAAAAEAAATAAAAEAAATAAEMEAITTRSRKLEHYVKTLQKKQKALEEAHEQTQQQLATTHEAYKAARTQLITRERQLVEGEKSRTTESEGIVRERKLLSAAFYSMGMDYHTALVAGRAVHKNANNASLGRSWLSQQRSAPGNQP